MKKRKLFCEISPFCYQISVAKGCLLRYLRDFFSREIFANSFNSEKLPFLIYSHKSLIRRKLGEVDMTLQNNKAINLSLASPKISGVLIKPGETFSVWHLIGRTTQRKGYQKGLIIKQGQPSEGIGGGLCQLSNLIHWLVLHSPLEITEYHHHDGVDLFPDFGRQVPFGVGTSISYNYIDYRFKNNTSQTFQLFVYTDEMYLNAELYSDKNLREKYHIQSCDECFIKQDNVWYRMGKVRRNCIDKATGNLVTSEVIKENCAKILYDEKFIPEEKKRKI